MAPSYTVIELLASAVPLNCGYMVFTRLLGNGAMNGLTGLVKSTVNEMVVGWEMLPASSRTQA